MSVQSQEDAMMRLKGKADEFQKHAARLAEVARQSAAISADARSESCCNYTSFVTHYMTHNIPLLPSRDMGGQRPFPLICVKKCSLVGLFVSNLMLTSLLGVLLPPPVNSWSNWFMLCRPPTFCVGCEVSMGS